MKKRFASLLALCAVASAFAGCTIFPPTGENLRDIMRSWGNDVSELQKLTDKYFFNYDYDDPFNE